MIVPGRRDPDFPAHAASWNAAADELGWQFPSGTRLLSVVPPTEEAADAGLGALDDLYNRVEHDPPFSAVIDATRAFDDVLEQIWDGDLPSDQTRRELYKRLGYALLESYSAFEPYTGSDDSAPRSPEREIEYANYARNLITVMALLAKPLIMNRDVLGGVGLDLPWEGSDAVPNDFLLLPAINRLPEVEQEGNDSDFVVAVRDKDDELILHNVNAGRRAPKAKAAAGVLSLSLYPLLSKDVTRLDVLDELRGPNVPSGGDKGRSPAPTHQEMMSLTARAIIAETVDPDDLPETGWSDLVAIHPDRRVNLDKLRGRIMRNILGQLFRPETVSKDGRTQEQKGDPNSLSDPLKRFMGYPVA